MGSVERMAMAIATYKNLCIDAVDEPRLATFYADVFGLADGRKERPLAVSDGNEFCVFAP